VQKSLFAANRTVAIGNYLFGWSDCNPKSDCATVTASLIGHLLAHGNSALALIPFLKNSLESVNRIPGVGTLPLQIRQQFAFVMGSH
jgi:hypothetical protein